MRQTLNNTGIVLGNTAYDPWGQAQSGTVPTFGFTGEVQQGANVYLRARWYNTQRGVFSSRDPFAGMPEQPYSLMPYQYAYSNPVMLTDPSGRNPVCAIGLAGGPPGWVAGALCEVATYAVAVFAGVALGTVISCGSGIICPNAGAAPFGPDVRPAPGPLPDPHTKPRPRYVPGTDYIPAPAPAPSPLPPPTPKVEVPGLPDLGSNACPTPGPTPQQVTPTPPTPLPTPTNEREVYLYHYTLMENIPNILKEGLRASVNDPSNPKSDANWGNGQYLTDLTPEESGTATRSQHSYALFTTRFHWGPFGRDWPGVGWIKIRVNELPVRNVHSLLAALSTSVNLSG